MHKLIIKNNKNKLTRGFTLIELLITITMFVIITGVVLVNSKSFDSSVLLNNFAYDVALTIKQAQSYGVNVNESSNTYLTSPFNYAYGVYFNIKVQGGTTNFVLFNDTDSSQSASINKIYDGSIIVCPSTNTECIQKYTIRKGSYIKALCAGSSESDCDSHPVDQLSILFQRPNLDAQIYKNNVYTDNLSDLQSYAKITLTSESGNTQDVVVTSVGQIYVQKKQTEVFP